MIGQIAADHGGAFGAGRGSGERWTARTLKRVIERGQRGGDRARAWVAGFVDW